MNLKKINILIGIIVVVLLIWFVRSNKSSYKNQKTIIGGKEFSLEVADIDELRTKGLSGRKKLSENEGMIFIFPQKNNYSFWMKEMYIPLDFLWVDNKTVVDLTENVLPPTNFNSKELPLVTPLFPVDKVIEVSSGTIKRLGIKKGDYIKFID